MMAVDTQIGQILDVLDPNGDGTGTALNDALIIRTSDHGEMALAHDGLRQKAFVAYEEALRVPLIWSNPGMFPAAKTTDAMVSHVDLLPTLCELTGVPNWQGKGFKGIDYSQVLLQPDINTSPTAVQPYVLFTFDDIYAGQNEATTGPTGVVNPPNRIQVVRTSDFKLARYWDGSGTQPPAPDQGEFYDLRPNGGDYYANDGAGGSVVYNAAGPLEMINLSDIGFTPPPLTSGQQIAYTELQGILQQETSASGRLASTPLNAAAAPQSLKIQMVPFTAQGQPPAITVSAFSTTPCPTRRLSIASNGRRSVDASVCPPRPTRSTSCPSPPGRSAISTANTVFTSTRNRCLIAARDFA
jgi:choline-sulfatase